MPKPRSVLLLVDAAINFLLGLLLLGFSRPLAHLLGVPYTDGQILSDASRRGIIRHRHRPDDRGLSQVKRSGGIGPWRGCGHQSVWWAVLLFWLLSGVLDLPLRGLVFLWVLAIVLVGISAVELLAHYRKRPPV